MNHPLLSRIDGLLVTNQTNIRYLTGFISLSTEEREAYVLVTNKYLYLFTNVLYQESAKQLSNSQIKFLTISRENPISKQLSQLIIKLGIKKLGFEEYDLTFAEFSKLSQKLKGVSLAPTKNRVEGMRMVKRTVEIANIKSAARLTDKCFDFILAKIKPRVTEKEIAWKIEKFFKENGAQIAFSPIVAFGKNTSQPHYQVQPQGPALNVNSSNFVLLDFGAKVNGYCSDMTRVVFIGKPKDEWKRAYNTVLLAQQQALEYLHAQGPALSLQLSGSQADEIARSAIKRAGFPPYPHSLGHGVGLDIHEAPRLSIKKDAILKPGMVVTVEPAIYIEGQYGIRIEDLVVLKRKSIEILSKSTKTLTIL